MTQSQWLFEMAWKGTVVLFAAFAAAAMLRSASASARHFVWAGAFVALLALPAAILVTPRWSPAAAALAPDAGTVIRVHAAADVPQPEPVQSASLWFLVWSAGFAFAALRFAAGAWRVRGIVRRGRPITYAQADRRVIESGETVTPLACGIFKPVIVLPEGAASWSAARLATALRHESAHIARRDAAAQALAHAACCFYWFHPLAWAAERQMRRQRERACDDAVLAAGASPDAYAGDLLEMARVMAVRPRASHSAPAMAEGSDLETRIQAMLDPLRNRRPLGMGAMAAIALAVFGCLASTAAFSAHAQTPQGVLAGVVEDPSGARIPGCQVTAKNTTGPNQETTTTNAAGEYRFAAIPSGTYSLEFGARGFALAHLTAQVQPDAAAGVDAHLELGSIKEMVMIAGKRPPTVTPQVAPSSNSGPIRVGGLVQPARLTTHVNPAYPSELQQLGIEGDVIIQAIVSKQGEVAAEKVVNSNVDSRLARQALDAVRQWRYSPALLNNQPVAVVTTITVSFTLN